MKEFSKDIESKRPDFMKVKDELTEEQKI